MANQRIEVWWSKLPAMSMKMRIDYFDQLGVLSLLTLSRNIYTLSPPTWPYAYKYERNGKTSNFEISQFFQQLWSSPSLWKYMNFWSESVVCFRRCRLDFFFFAYEQSHVNINSPMLTKTKTNRKYMVARYLSPKVGINPLDGFQ